MEPPADRAVRNRYIFDRLAYTMFGEEWKPDEQGPEAVERTKRQLQAAIDQHRALAKEFCLTSVRAAAVEAGEILAASKAGKPLDFRRYKHLMYALSDPKEPPSAGQRRLTEAQINELGQKLLTRVDLTFRYCIWDLGIKESYKLVQELRARFPEMKWSLPLKAINDYMIVDFDDLSTRVQRQVAAQLGFENVEKAVTVNGLLQMHKLAWNPKQIAVHMMTFDPGAADAMGRILRVAVESHGDGQKVSLAILKEIVNRVPLVGDAISVAEGGVHGFCILVLTKLPTAGPYAGAVMVVIGLGQSGAAIYEAEYAAPARSNAEDAIYREFLGPDTRWYQKPPDWTDQDVQRLAQLKAELDRLTELSYQLRRSDAPLDPAQAAAASAKNRQNMAAQIKNLEDRQAAWTSYQDKMGESAAWGGGYWTAAGAQPVQKPFRNYLLEQIPLIVMYTPGGVIDFRVKFTPEDQQELKRLHDWLTDAAAHPQNVAAEEFLQNLQKHDALADREDKYSRAQKYLEHAQGYSDAQLVKRLADAAVISGSLSQAQMDKILSERHPATALQLAQEMVTRKIVPSEAAGAMLHVVMSGEIELRHQIQRDSLYPARLQMAASGQDPGPLRNPEEFVKVWFKDNKAVMQELCDQRLLYLHVNASPTYGVQEEQFLPLGSLSEESMENLSQRFSADFERSKRLWQLFQEQDSFRKTQLDQWQQKRLDAYQAASVGAFLSKVETDPRQEEDRGWLKEYLWALRIAAAKNRPPKIKATVYVRHVESQPAGAGSPEAGRRSDADSSAKEPATEFIRRYGGGLETLYGNSAEPLVILTGDRNRGAELLRKSQELSLATTPAERREARRKEWESKRPPWWPDESPAKP